MIALLLMMLWVARLSAIDSRLHNFVNIFRACTKPGRREDGSWTPLPYLIIKANNNMRLPAVILCFNDI